MRYSNQGRFRQQVRFLRRQFLQDGDLPFTQRALGRSRFASTDSDQAYWVDRIYSPLVTLWVFLGQVLSADPFLSCGSCSLDRPSSVAGTASVLCGDRRLLPGQKASARRVLLGRGSPDRPRVGSQRRSAVAVETAPRLRLSTARRCRCPIRRRTSAIIRNPTRRSPAWAFRSRDIAAVFSLACGAVLDLGICRYAGKGQSELGMLRTLWNIFRPGDVLLADRLMCAWTEMVMLKQRGVDCVCRFTSHRKADFRRGKRLGPGDHIVSWPKPTKPRSIDRETVRCAPRVP